MIIISRKIQVICSWKDVGKLKIWESSLTVYIYKLTFEDHITEKVNKAYAILGIIKRNFDHIGK